MVGVPGHLHGGQFFVIPNKKHVGCQCSIIYGGFDIVFYCGFGSTAHLGQRCDIGLETLLVFPQCEWFDFVQKPIRGDDQVVGFRSSSPQYRRWRKALPLAPNSWGRKFSHQSQHSYH